MRFPTTRIQARWQWRKVCQRAGFARAQSAFDLVPFPAADVFVETGVGNGETLRAAVRSGRYRQVLSFEVNPVLAAAALWRLSPWSLPSGVSVRCGSSPLLLRTCDPGRSTVFWLDAHYSGGTYAALELDPVHGQCPLLAELAAIFALPWHVPPVIFIDDVLCFEATRYEGTYAFGIDRAQFPTRDQIAAALPADYRLVAHDGRYYEAQSHGYSRRPWDDAA